MEWDILASWVVANELYSDNNVWLIQVRGRGGHWPFALGAALGWPADNGVCGSSKRA